VSRLDELLDDLPRWILVVGKGGVGKTTFAVAVAARAAARAQDVLLLSTDPARSLGAALGETVGPVPVRVKRRDHLFAMQLEAQHERDRFLAQWRDILVTILDRGTYLHSDDVAGVVDDTLPGVDEAMALLALLELERDARWQRIVVDTAPTGHTLRLLALPDTFRALVMLLDTMQNKHRFMVQALARRYRPDAADAFLSRMRDDIDALRAALVDPVRTAAVLITRAEPMVVAETLRYADALGARSIHIGGLVINAVDGSQSASTRQQLSALAPVAPHAKRLEVPRADRPPNGLDEIEGLFTGVTAGKKPAGAPAPSTMPERPHSVIATVLRPLTIVAGKGGVGKTTVACALGVSFARPANPVLIVSSDPAPSVADALSQPVPDEDVDVESAPGCRARQMDATMAFERFRARYIERVDAVFERLMGGSLHLTYDKAVVRDLLAMAPPGIDELYALVTLGEVLAEGQYEMIIVDPAPTGHLLRLLEMPALALAWAHRLMRLMIEYKEIGGLGELAQELLDFAKRTRALRELLNDPERAAVLVVANDEPLVRGESGRLVRACRERGIDVGALVWNRVNDGVAPLSALHPARQFVAPALSPAPRGVVALKRWCATWRPIEDAAFA
jgi:arsenite-transporting ATPase